MSIEIDKQNRDKIILMTKLALYDRRFGKRDKKAACFFRHDYIYLKNMWTRFFVICGLVIIFGLYWINIVFASGIDYFVENFVRHASFGLITMIIVCLIYTAVGSVKATAEYEKAMKRLAKYNLLLGKLDEMR
ncbi:MAG: hypothetical protein FWE29_04420 [Defluviitaleaceae bacterium]|nr:hypothetical protein [Defluviitaleaceae bacterium]